MKPGVETNLAEAFAFAEVMAQERTSPGVLVFTASLQLLYINREAQELTRCLHEARVQCTVKGVLPRQVMEFCEELVSLLQTHSASKDWEQLQHIRVVGAPQCPVLLRGFGIPHTISIQETRLLILMEALHDQSEFAEVRVQERYHLTDREQTIIIYLLQGLTNKEIACLMQVSEHTVKEHLKHIMKKTKTTTRTGLLARIIFAAAAPSSKAELLTQYKAVNETRQQST